jgi:hypothetical protein
MNGEDREKLKSLENKIASIERKIDDITTNHLPHLTEKVAYVQGKMKAVWPLTIAILCAMVGLVVTCIIYIK